jgi:sigma-B regulation protein RsbU (phosphoserine phosphatase)
MCETLLDRHFPADPAALADVREAMRAACHAAGCSQACMEQVVLATHEACMNIIQHGYRHAPGRDFRVQVMRDEGRLRVQLADHGRPATLADLQPRALDDVRPGGLGVHFMREMMDDVTYLPAPQGLVNLLQLTKRIS